ncbi:MAG TPA: UDP-N-acetylmuramate--L-alanine ligase [Acidimicrobiales bacterium]|nr:UDP-N-acetylmuramate--L-alanine ligase [Acidimicrobiales bacterium]
MSELDLTVHQHVHIVGIGGAGMSAIATVLAAMGHTVSGSDLRASAATERLTASGIDVEVGHRADHLAPGVTVVALSTAIPRTNPEVAAAVERGIPVLRRADVLAAICATRRTVAVAGTHGKTTTSSMLALVLVEADLHPSFIIGGQVNEIGSGAAWDRGDLFVVEADESDGTFLELGADAVVVTSVEADHLDQWGSFEAIEAGFARFVGDAAGPRVVCIDDAGAARLAGEGVTTYGTSEAADYRIVDVVVGRASTTFSVEHGGRRLGAISLPVPGEHNARNACAALTMGLLLGAPFEAAAGALARYAGVARRFQFRGERDGITFVDDYAHNPGKVKAVLAAARAGGWRRVVCIFQPHLYSRTADLAAEFGESFRDADLVVVTDVYGAREAPVPGVTGKLIVDAILDADPSARVVWLPGRADLARHVRALLRPGDLCLTLGAGDITLLHDEMLRGAE